MQEFLLGFDARERAGGQAWGEERRKQFLLRLDVEAPRSVDRRVWESVFDVHTELRPAYTGIWDEMWEDLQSLEACVKQGAGHLGVFCIVAFGVMRQACSGEQHVALDHFLEFLKAGDPEGAARIAERQGGISRPDRLGSNWSLLGYDVADLGLTSGLTNIGFRPEAERVDVLRARWSPHLNTAHLFDDLPQAIEFKNFCSQRVPEHAPFFVFGLWLVHSDVEPL